MFSFSTKTKTPATTTTTPTTTAAGTRNISPIFDRKIDETTAGQRFSSLKDQERTQVLESTKPELLLASSFTQSLARALGENFSILDGQKRNEVWEKVRRNDAFAKDFGEELRRHYSELDEETEREALQVANEVPSFRLDIVIYNN